MLQKKYIWSLASLGFAVVCLLALLFLYYRDFSEYRPSLGGVYREGIIGTVSTLNPLFISDNNVEENIGNLVNCSLTKFDSDQKKVVPSVATYTVDKEKKTYTFTLKDGVTFHDGKPVTVDDVVFTYQQITANPDFKNAFLSSSFDGVVVEKMDDKNVVFRLSEPYYFFPSLLTVGILPKHIWDSIPVNAYDDPTLDENKRFVGCGPYQLLKVDTESKEHEVTLESYEKYFEGRALVRNVIFRLFDSYEQLAAHMGDIDGISSVPYEALDLVREEKRFNIVSYEVPRYVALFLNTDSPVLKDAKTRLALQLGFNKVNILHEYPYVRRVDTPFLELDDKEWTYTYDQDKAKGGLFDAGWKLPRQALRQAQDLRPLYAELMSDQIAATSGGIYEPSSSSEFYTYLKKVYVRGYAPAGTDAVYVNGIRLNLYKAGGKTWSFRADTSLGTMKRGKNVFSAYASVGGKKQLIDTITIYQGMEEPKPAPVAVETPKPTPVVNTNVNAAAPKTNANANAAVANTNLNTAPTTTNANINLNQNIAKVVSASGSTVGDTQIRVNQEGKKLILGLYTLEGSLIYQRISEAFQKDMQAIGVGVELHYLNQDDLMQVIEKRSYDILLFGQTLGYNLDTYPYWNSTQATGSGLNLSDFESVTADQLLKEIRSPRGNFSSEEQLTTYRNAKLEEVNKIFREQVPAIFLYKPLLYTAIDRKILNVHFDMLGYPQDRFSKVHTWYTTEQLSLKEPLSVPHFFGWLKSKVFHL